MRQLDELRFVRPLSSDAHPFRVTVMRTARITVIYIGFAISGSLAAAITSLLATSNRKVVLCGLILVTIAVVLAYATSMHKSIARLRTKTRPVETTAESDVPQLRLEALVPVLLLYTSERLTNRYVNNTKRAPHEYVYQAFDRVLSDGLDTRENSLMPVLCSTIDALIARDSRRRT